MSAKCWFAGIVLAMGVSASAGAVTFDTTGTKLRLDIPYNTNLQGRTSAVGDANNDGRMDVVMYAYDGAFHPVEANLQLWLYEQQQDGTMAVARTFTAYLGPDHAYGMGAMMLADLNEDGFAEIGLQDGDRFVFLGRTPSGPYVPVGSVPNSLQPDYQLTDVIVRDFDRDGHLDLMLVQSGAGLAIFRGHGNLQFDPPAYIMAYDRTRPQFADVDGNGREDMVTSTREFAIGDRVGLGVHESLPAPDFFGRSVYQRQLPGDIYAPAVGDFDGDGDQDIAAVTAGRYNTGPNTVQGYTDVRMFLRQSNGTYVEGPTNRLLTQSNPPDAEPLVVTDLDGDGRSDLITVVDYRVVVLLGQAGGGFSLAQNFQPGGTGSYHRRQVADFNGDGCLDFGHTSREYVIHYRTDCPTQNPFAPAASRPMKASQPPRMQRARAARRPWWRFW
jgi:hypothetical protein